MSTLKVQTPFCSLPCYYGPQLSPPAVKGYQLEGHYEENLVVRPCMKICYDEMLTYLRVLCACLGGYTCITAD